MTSLQDHSKPKSPPLIGRRALLYMGVGGAAALAGAGAAIWKWTPGKGLAEVDPDFWSLTFETPDGASLGMQSLRGRPLLLNFWATWCPPCVEELPLLDTFHRQNSAHSWQVVGLAIDQPSAVRNFLKRTPVRFPIGLAGMVGTELGKSFGNLSGGLPFTVLIGAEGKVLERRMGRVTAADLSEWSRLS